MKHVAVLMGGWSAEREVSLSSGKGCSEALKKAGYKVTSIDIDRNLVETLKKVKPDIVFNALHATFGEDGGLQGVLEMLEIPYTHSGLLASAIAMEKPIAKKIFASEGMRVPEGKVVLADELKKGDPIKRPYVVKPTNLGSSVGVYIVQEGDNWNFNDIELPAKEFLVEKFIPGREITVGIMGDRILGATEIRPVRGFYDYTAKYTSGVADHICPAPLPERAYKEVCELGLRAHKALGCRGVSRSDFRYDDAVKGEEKFYILELNTTPGMTPLSLIPELARHQGISYEELVDWLVKQARTDSGIRAF